MKVVWVCPHCNAEQKNKGEKVPPKCDRCQIKMRKSARAT